MHQPVDPTQICPYCGESHTFSIPNPYFHSLRVCADCNAGWPVPLDELPLHPVMRRIRIVGVVPHGGPAEDYPYAGK